MELLGLIEDYRQGLVPLIVPLTLLKDHLKRHSVPEWVDEQVYLHPHPKELMLRTHVGLVSAAHLPGILHPKETVNGRQHDVRCDVATSANSFWKPKLDSS